MKKGAVSMRTQKNAAVGDRPTNEELVQRLQEGDTSAAEELLRQNSGYLTVLAKQYDRTVRGPSLEEDLKQEGAMALLKAAEQFDPTLGNRFLTYATPVIQAAMRDCAARSALPLTVPAGRYHQLRHLPDEACGVVRSSIYRSRCRSGCERCYIGNGIGRTRYRRRNDVVSMPPLAHAEVRRRTGKFSTQTGDIA